MYVETVPNRNSRPAILLREGMRVGKKVVKRTIANLTNWPAGQVESLRRLLRGEKMVSVEEAFAVRRSLPHGHVEAVMEMVRLLGLETLIAPKRCRERDLVVAMIVQRILAPSSKLAATRLWSTTTLAEQLGVEGAEVNELYRSLIWLLERQSRIENRLSKRHLSEKDTVLYDISSSYYEGHTCPLMLFGYSRDHRKDLPQVVYGVLTDKEGCPVSVSVYKGNVGDASTVPDQVEKLRKAFGLERIVLVGDRGMLTQMQIQTLRKYPGLGWISTLRSQAIRQLIKQGCIERTLFDESNLAEIMSPEFPDERLVVCLNPMLADNRRRKREALLEWTEQALAAIAGQVARRTRKPMNKAEIALKVGAVLNKKKMKKHFLVTIEDGLLEYRRNEDSITEEQALDGIYVVRTSEQAEEISSEDAVRTYKRLAQVERAFRTLKGLDLQIRPIRHRLEETVRAHIFLCMLAYYVEWHLRKAWATVLFEDEYLEQDRARRDPVAPAQCSPEAKRKKVKRITEDGHPVHSFQTLLATLATRVKSWCGPRNGPSQIVAEVITDRTQFQEHVFQLLELFPVAGISK